MSLAGEVLRVFLDDHETHGTFPLHFAEHSSRDVEEEEKEEEKDDDEDNDDGDEDTAHGSNAAISSLFTNFGRERQERANARTVTTVAP